MYDISRFKANFLDIGTAQRGVKIFYRKNYLIISIVKALKDKLSCQNQSKVSISQIDGNIDSSYKNSKKNITKRK